LDKLQLLTKRMVAMTNTKSEELSREVLLILSLLAGVVMLALAGCHRTITPANKPNGTLVITAPFTTGKISVDGNLDEPCYYTPPLVEDFVIAGQPGKQPSKTKAWLFWQRDKLIFAFDCEDADLVAAPPSSKKHDVDRQDRVELFLWSGQPQDTYYCIEIGGRGALHDYSARFYRRFDDEWSLEGLEYTAKSTPQGYSVEGTISRTTMKKMGFYLEPGAQWRLGFFRADFAAGNNEGEPNWITWIDAKGPKPDFHVAESFGTCTLGPQKE
jgi:hypothetical protein